MKKYSIGVDYGTNSVRALIVDTSDGSEIGCGVFNYPSGEKGILLDSTDPELARQNPQDYIDGFIAAVSESVKHAAGNPEFSPSSIVGIGIDTTGSTPIPVDAQGIPLAMLPHFRDNLAAYAWLWKDHTSTEEAEEITRIAGRIYPQLLSKIGGRYSSEWYWAKLWHCLKTAPEIFENAAAWVELADFIPAWITGNRKPEKIIHGICAAGHKCFYSKEWGGLPPAEFFAHLAPGLAALRKTMDYEAYPSSHIAGYLQKETADLCGLVAGIPVACGAFDCHHGAVGAGIKEGTLVNTMGTSSCIIMVHPLQKKLADIPGLCGIVPESVMPGMYGLESGQSAVGDLYAWFADKLCPAECNKQNAHAELSAEAAKLKPGQSGLLALDWNNGNRCTLVDQALTGLLIGQTLHTTAPDIFRALIEATAFGARKIIEQHINYGVQVKEIIVCGGIAGKNPLVMQIYADVCNYPVKISRSAQTCALGAAIFGAVAGGAYPDTPSAQNAMTGIKDTVYTPDPKSCEIYEKLYSMYSSLHDAFSADESQRPDLSRIMKDLIAVRDNARKSDICRNSAHVHAGINPASAVSAELSGLKEEVYAANIDLLKHKLVKLTWGNVSALSGDGKHVVIKPSGVDYATMRPADMVVMNLASGEVIDGDYRPSSDAPTHLALYRAWKDMGIRGIVHTHSPMATIFAQSCCELMCYGTTHADHFNGTIPVTRFLSSEEVNTEYEANTGKLILERFRDISPVEMPGVLVAGHGPFAWGGNAHEAVVNSVALEEVALMAMSMKKISADMPALPEYIIDKHYQRKHGKDAYYGQKTIVK